MDRRKFDVLMRQTLQERAEMASMSETRKQRIYEAVSESSKEDYRMRFRSGRKMIVAVAAMCVLGSIVALGAGKVVGYSSGHAVDNPEFATYAEMGKAKEQAGFPVKAVERFDNGYEFQQGYLINVNAHDENNQVVDTFPEVSVYYQKGGQMVVLTVEKVRPEWEASTTGNPVDIAYGDLTMTYREDHYKFVPPDYELTEEDQRAMDSGEVYISYGSDEVEFKEFHFMTWEEGEVHYSLMAYGDGALGQQEMEQMAKQVVDSPEL